MRDGAKTIKLNSLSGDRNLNIDTVPDDRSNNNNLALNWDKDSLMGLNGSLYIKCHHRF